MPLICTCAMHASLFQRRARNVYASSQRSSFRSPHANLMLLIRGICLIPSEEKTKSNPFTD